MEEGEERKGMMGVAGPGTTDVTPSGREMGMAEAGARSDTRACDSSCRVTVGFRRTRPRLFTPCMMLPCKLHGQPGLVATLLLLLLLLLLLCAAGMDFGG